MVATRISLAETIACAYAKELLPARVASGLFWRAAQRSPSLIRDKSITATVRFEDASLRLVLPLAYRQNWTILFGQFSRSSDGLMLREFVRRARGARGIIDVGANAGLYTYHAAAIAPQVPVLALEPIEELAELLRANLNRNGRAATRVANVAASDAAGQAEFFVADSDEVSSLDSAHVDAYEGNVSTRRVVRTATLDELVREHGFEHVDLIKIDVEGHELSVLRGAAETLRIHRPALFVEVTSANADEARALLRCINYRSRRFDAIGLIPTDQVPDRHAFANFLCEHVGTTDP
jgi:FkbM family methyltransferase